MRDQDDMEVKCHRRSAFHSPDPVLLKTSAPAREGVLYYNEGKSGVPWCRLGGYHVSATGIRKLKRGP